MTPEQIAALKAALEAKMAEGLLSLAASNKTLETALNTLSTQFDVVKSKLAISLPGVELENKGDSLSFARVYYAMKTGMWDQCPFEKEVRDQTLKLVGNDAATQKLLAAGNGSTGGFVVPLEFSRKLIELLYAQSVVLKMGASRVNPQGIPFEIPKMVGGAFATWADEGAVIPESQGAFGKISLTPKYLTSLVPMSDRVIQYSDPAMESLVRQDMIRQMDLALDYGCLFGDGTNSSPIGLANQEGINSLAVHADGDEPDYDFLLDMQGLVEDANALEGSLGFISHPSMFRRVRKQKVLQYSGDPKGAPQFSPIMTDDQLTGAIGKHASTTAISKILTKGGSGATLTSAFYGNWAELIVALWGSLVLKASDQMYFNRNITCLKAVMEGDCGIRHPESFTYAPYVRRS